MLKHRLIFGILFTLLLSAVFYFDQTLSVGWPAKHLSLPPGTIMALALVAVIPLGLIEMRNLLAAARSPRRRSQRVSKGWAGGWRAPAHVARFHCGLRWGEPWVRTGVLSRQLRHRRQGYGHSHQA